MFGAEELIGFPRHLSTHVGGFVITRGPLTELAVVTRAAMENRHTIEWDKDDIEALRILKVDVLGLGMLTCVRRAFALIAAHGGPALTLQTVPQDDPETYAMLRRADSVGVFQVESRAQMNMLPRLRPRAFYDLVIQGLRMKSRLNPGRRSCANPPGAGACSRRSKRLSCAWRAHWPWPSDRGRRG